MSPVSNFKGIQLDQLYLPFLQRLLDMIAGLNNENFFFKASQGYRSFPVQDDLFAKGRTAPGPIVTQARGGESAHNFGLAVDFVRIIDGAASWKNEDYDILGFAAAEYGLVWGGSWTRPDRPHIQFPGYVTAEELAPLKAIYLANSDSPLTSVFKALDAKGLV